MHINYWNRKYEKKQPSLFCLSQHSFILFLQPGRPVVCVLAPVSVCVVAGGRKYYANVSRKHHFNTSHVRLCCLWVHPFSSYMHLLTCAAQLSVMRSYAAWKDCVDSFGVTEVAAACFERQVFTRSEHNNNKRKNKPSKHGGLVSTRLQISQLTMRFLLSQYTSGCL